MNGLGKFFVNSMLPYNIKIKLRLLTEATIQKLFIFALNAVLRYNITRTLSEEIDEHNSTK